MLLQKLFFTADGREICKFNFKIFVVLFEREIKQDPIKTCYFLQQKVIFMGQCGKLKDCSRNAFLQRSLYSRDLNHNKR